jgi:hypothetical protein
VIFEPRKNISRHILRQHWYAFPIHLPVRRNPQHRRLLIVAISTGRPIGHHLRLSKVLERISRPSCESLYATNTSHHKQETFLYEYLLQWILLPTKKAHNRTPLFGSTLLKHGRHFVYWKQSLNMRVRVCCLDCHEAGLCCYLAIHIENLLHPLQLFYFHLWPIYWLSVVSL